MNAAIFMIMSGLCWIATLCVCYLLAIHDHVGLSIAVLIIGATISVGGSYESSTTKKRNEEATPNE